MYSNRWEISEPMIDEFGLVGCYIYQVRPAGEEVSGAVVPLDLAARGGVATVPPWRPPAWRGESRTISAH